MKRRTFAQVEARAREDERRNTVAELCRVLKWHLEQPELADKLDALMKSDQPKKQGPAAREVFGFSGFDFFLAY